MPNPLVIRAIARPIFPNPINPTVFPCNSVPISSGSGHSHRFLRVNLSILTIFLARPIIRANACSAMVLDPYSGQLTTMTPFRVAASRSMLSTPTPYFKMALSRPAFSIIAAEIFVKQLTMIRSTSAAVAVNVSSSLFSQRTRSATASSSSLTLSIWTSGSVNKILGRISVFSL